MTELTRPTRWVGLIDLLAITRQKRRKTLNTFKLAADTVNGVYEVSSIPPGTIMSDFTDELKDDFEGTKYAIVDEAEAKQIDDEYGIKWL